MGPTIIHTAFTLLASLAFATAAPSSFGLEKSCMEKNYYCASAAQTLTCCTGTMAVGSLDRAGCAPCQSTINRGHADVD
jgi:hypothetical protein